jgi:hypothetical protein
MIRRENFCGVFAARGGKLEPADVNVNGGFADAWLPGYIDISRHYCSAFQLGRSLRLPAIAAGRWEVVNPKPLT